MLGYNSSNVPHPVIESLNQIKENLPKLLKPEGGYKLFQSDLVSFGKDRFEIDGITFNCEKIIASNFKKCDSIIILVITLGNEISDYIRNLMDNGEILTGFVADKIASEIVEQFADKIELKIANDISSNNLNITNRYSPGYCGWSVNEQHKLFSLLPEKFCGIKLTESALMTPIKSISAVIGVGENAKKRDYQCSICDIEFCYKRERNE